MRAPVVSVLAAGLVVGGFALTYGFQRPSTQLARITVDYPQQGSVFPPEITPPTFLWRDEADNEDAWAIEIRFANRGPAIRVTVPGERMRVGEIDPEAVAASNEPPKLTPEQAAARVWTPGDATWTAIKKRSVTGPATVTFTGMREGKAVSRGSVRITTSADPVGAPIFYRDVPLMPNTSDKGVVKPIPADAIGLIKWRLRYLNERQSHVVMEKPATCANCHSFSLDGKTMGLDVDGPQNDRGLYAVIPVAKRTAIRTQDVIKWPTVRDPKIERLRASFMSQVSPDGRYVLTTTDDPEASKRVSGDTLEDKYFNANFMDYRFLQVFYPTRGILAWYDREAKVLRPLPGADDPKYVQTDGVWSPDMKFIVFARAEAKSPYLPGAKPALAANDPNETQIQYELYRIPFNEGRGGRPERIAGASANGMSNNFPKVSPDGRWIVFVKCRNGQLMRPDSKLYIVPAQGGEARLMKCNTSLMNSWHTFSPNGRWMAFSSKSRSPYTQMYLTHIDANGNDTPPILVENSTAANRAVNLPEFVNIPPGGLEKIDSPATDYYGLFNTADALTRKRQFEDALREWRRVLEIEPGDGKAHFAYGFSLSESGRVEEAIAEFRKACELSPEDPAASANLALALAGTGKYAEAIANYRQSLKLNAANPAVESDLGVALFMNGQPAEAIEHEKRSIELNPEFAEGYNRLGYFLARAGQPAEALSNLQKAVALDRSWPEYRFNLAYVLSAQGDHTGAIEHLEKAVELTGGKDAQCLSLLGAEYDKVGRQADAAQAVRRALDLAVAANNQELAKSLRETLDRLSSPRPQ